MGHIRSSIFVLGLVLAGCSKPNLVFERLPWEQADYYCIQGQPVYRTERKDFCGSDGPLLFDNPNATFPVPILFDESGGEGEGYDTLYIDVDGDGNFLNDPVYKAGEKEVGWTEAFGGEVLAYFENVRIVHGRKRKRFAHVQVVLLSSRDSDGSVTNWCVMVPQQWAVGTVQVAGKAVPAALIDRNWNDRLTDRAGLNLKEHPGKFPRGDYLVLAIDGEEDIVPGSRLGRDGGTARGILTEFLALDSGVYRVQAEQLPGGVKLELVRAELPRGKIDLTGRGGQRLLLIGTKTCVLLRVADKEVSIPADTYIPPLWDSQFTFTVRPGQTAEANRPAPKPVPDDGMF